MRYPIFHSFTARIENELRRRSIKTEVFSRWEEPSIHATGLEIRVPLREASPQLLDLTIHFDWDRYRESVLARRLPGMEAHPLVRKPLPVSPLVGATMDMEITWRFDPTPFQALPDKLGTGRIEAASDWMDRMSRHMRDHYAKDDTLTRWHIEIEGDERGRYLSVISLITYPVVSFEHAADLNDVHQVVSRHVQAVLIRSNRLIGWADQEPIRAVG